MASALRISFAKPKGINFRPFTKLFSTETHSKKTANLRLEPYEFTHESIFTEEHAELRTSLNKLIEKEINPYVDEWENAKSFPAHKVFKKVGSAGFFGVNKPPNYGGLGLDYSYSVAMAEELGESIKLSENVQIDLNLNTLKLYVFGYSTFFFNLQNNIETRRVAQVNILW